MSHAAVSDPVQTVVPSSLSHSNHKEKLAHQRIQKVGVLGAGTMGARIAAHLANAGVPCYLLDIVPPNTPPEAGKAARNKIVAAGLDAAIM
jgi:phosphoglycerate dehydrogenase-like enzyme